MSTANPFEQHGSRNLAVGMPVADPGNRRAETRFEIGVRGALSMMEELDARPDQFPTLVHDVSRQGLRLSTRTMLRAGERALVRFALPGAQARTRTVRIRWVKHVGEGYEAGAEAADWLDDDGSPLPPDGSEASAAGGYYEAEGEFLDDDPTITFDGAPLPPSPAKVAAAYEGAEAPQVALPPATRSPTRDAPSPRFRVLDARPVQDPHSSSLELIAVILFAAAVVAALWLALIWQSLSP